MPWQRLVCDVGLEVDPTTGHLAYRELVVTVMRQSGKTTLLLSLELDRCLAWGERQNVAYSAQTGVDARKKLIEDQVPILESSPLWGAVTRVRRAMGHEGLQFRGGSRIDVVASGESAGHGQTIDFAVADEAFKDIDHRREQAMLPAMATRPDAQFAVMSTKGTEKSLFLNNKIERGRAAAQADKGTGVAYFEWSIPTDQDVDDPDIWWQYMPALGWTIQPAAIEHARQTMSDGEFRRAFCNQQTFGEDRLIPDRIWQRVCSTDAKPNGPYTFGIDILPDRSSAAIVVASGGTVELIDHQPGVGWIVERCQQLAREWGGTFTVDKGGPAGSIDLDLIRADLKVKALSNMDVVAACANWYDAIADGTVTVRQHDAFDAATAGLAKRPVGDRWVWARSTSATDITPIMAASLALYVSADIAPAPFAVFT